MWRTGWPQTRSRETREKAVAVVQARDDESQDSSGKEERGPRAVWRTEFT